MTYEVISIETAKKLEKYDELLKEKIIEENEILSELQNRIDKAIEYINKYKNQNWYIESRFTEELLNILQGEQNE